MLTHDVVDVVKLAIFLNQRNRRGNIKRRILVKGGSRTNKRGSFPNDVIFTGTTPLRHDVIGLAYSTSKVNSFPLSVSRPVTQVRPVCPFIGFRGHDRPKPTTTPHAHTLSRQGDGRRTPFLIFKL